MNLLSFLGDVLHLISIFVLLLKMFSSRSSRGISLKTQFLYAIVFITRYLDLAHFFYRIVVKMTMPSFASTYLAFMKIVYIALSSFIVYLIYAMRPWSVTYEKAMDKVRIEVLIIPCFLVSLVWKEKFTAEEILYTFSLWLEAVAIVPQLVMVQQAAKQSGGFVENLTSHYVFALGGYRALYMLNWVYRMVTEEYYWHPIVWVTGTIQTAIYCDFFYYYITSHAKGEAMSLPV